MAETDWGRVLLVGSMHLRHGYDYDREPYLKYWRRAKELIDRAGGGFARFVALWRSDKNPMSEKFFGRD